jgi:uncharacterized protein involved in exopolysaccharide biosynthesis
MRSPSAVPHASAPPEALSLGQIATALWRRKLWVVFPTLLAMAGATLFVQFATPIYTAEATILLESRDGPFTRPREDRPELRSEIDEQAVASQVQVVLSRDLAREAVRRLGLVGNPEFDPLARGVGPLRQVLVDLGLVTNPLDRQPEDRVLDAYFRNLSVFNVGKSRILQIEFKSEDPDLAARAANTVAELYISLQEAAKKDTARSASAWLGSNIEALRKQVAEAEAKVEAYRTGAGLYAGANNGSIATQQLSELSTQHAQARSAQADAQAKARLIRDEIKAGRSFEIPDVANNELIRRLVEQRIGLRSQLALELRTLGPEHPRIKEMNAQVADLDGQVRGAAERVVRTLENEARIAGSRVETLQAAMDAQKQAVAQANESEVQHRALEREARALRDQLENYLSLFRQATARDAENAAPADARIVSRAMTPILPSYPKKVPLIALVTLATLALTAGAIVAGEILKGAAGPSERIAARPPVVAPERRTAPERGRTAPTPEAWASAPSVPREGTAVPLSGDPPSEPSGRADEPTPEPPFAVPARALDAPVRADEPDALAVAGEEAESERYDFAALIARLSSGDPSERARRVLVAGLDGGEEGAAMALGLGRTLAREGRAILLGLDGTDPDHLGFSDLVAGDASFVDVMTREPHSRLHRVGPGTQGAAALTEGDGLDLALAAFDQTYAWVLLALRTGEDAALLAVLAPRVDAVVIASEADPADPALVALYHTARDAGAPDVVVARETAGAQAAAA